MLRVAIVTRNAMHGGVETMIALHQRCFGAAVFAAGGYEFPGTCPFAYTYLDGTDPAQAQAKLTGLLAAYDVIIYHWPLWWAVEAIRASGKPSIEVIHRDDTADCDSTVPSMIVTHSHFLAELITRRCARPVTVIPHGLDVDRFPATAQGPYIGGITSYYYPVKGLDLFFKAWQQLQARYPEQRIRFYGAGSGLQTYRRMVDELGLKGVELLGPVAAPEKHFAEFRLIVQPSRIEGLPFALLEALACNIPVICSDLPGMVEFNRLARDRGATEPLILFRAGDAAHLAQRIAEQLNGPTTASDTRRYVSQYYGADAHCRELRIAVDRALEAYEQTQAAHVSLVPIASGLQAAQSVQPGLAGRQDALQTAGGQLASHEQTAQPLSAEVAPTSEQGSQWRPWLSRVYSWLVRLGGRHGAGSKRHRRGTLCN